MRPQTSIVSSCVACASIILLAGVLLVSPARAINACAFQFSSQNLCATLAWPPSASVGAEVKFQLQFHDQASGAARDPAGDVGLFLWMPMMGHGSRPVTIGHASGSGLYDVSEAYFVMAGDWDLHLTLKNGATSEESIVTVHL